LADLVVVWKQQLLIYLKGIPDKVEASFAVVAYESLARLWVAWCDFALCSKQCVVDVAVVLNLLLLVVPLDVFVRFPELMPLICTRCLCCAPITAGNLVKALLLRVELSLKLLNQVSVLKSPHHYRALKPREFTATSGLLHEGQAVYVFADRGGLALVYRHVVATVACES